MEVESGEVVEPNSEPVGSVIGIALGEPQGKVKEKSLGTAGEGSPHIWQQTKPLKVGKEVFSRQAGPKQQS